MIHNMQSKSARLTLIISAVFACGYSSEVSNTNCLYAITLDDKPVAYCPLLDESKLSDDKRVKHVIKSLGLNAAEISFRSCAGQPYHVSANQQRNENTIFVITYPLPVDKHYIAAITHELSHVKQIKVAGGMEALQNSYINRSKELELEADYISGVVFSSDLISFTINDFQHGLPLMGRYRELSHEAHGKPEERTSAFRLGLFLVSREGPHTIDDAMKKFREGIYEEITEEIVVE
jgi:hypothetical protein